MFSVSNVTNIDCLLILNLRTQGQIISVYVAKYWKIPMEKANPSFPRKRESLQRIDRTRKGFPFSRD